MLYFVYIICICGLSEGLWEDCLANKVTFFGLNFFSLHIDIVTIQIIGLESTSVSYWRKYVHEVLVNRLGGLSLPRKSVVRLTDRRCLPWT